MPHPYSGALFSSAAKQKYFSLTEELWYVTKTNRVDGLVESWVCMGIKDRLFNGFQNWNGGYDGWLKWCDTLYEPDAYYNIPGPHGQVRLTLQQYKDAMSQLFQHFTMELGAFENLITKGDWCAIRYNVKIRNLDTGDEILQNTMEFVKFKKNPDPIGVRVVEGWALSDISLA